MIANLDSLQKSYNTAPQHNNLWDFTLEDWSDASYSVNRFNMISTSLPFVTEFETESHPTGENFYTGFSYSKTFSIELRENTSFAVYNYFRDWLLTVFDPVSGNFISSDKPKTKTGTILFYSYKINPAAYNRFSAQNISEKLKNAQTAYSQTLIQQAKNIANSNLPYPLSHIASTGASRLSTLTQEGLNSLTPQFSDVFEEVTTKIFTLENVRIVGMNDVALSYDGGEQLTLTINLVADRFYDSELQKNRQSIDSFSRINQNIFLN